MKKKVVKKIKTYFLIVNLVVAVIAFSCLISGQVSDSPSDIAPLPSKINSLKQPSSTLNLFARADAGKDYKSLLTELQEKGEITAPKGSWTKATGDYLTEGIFNDFQSLLIWGGVGALIGSLTPMEDGEQYGAIAGLSGAIAKGIAEASVGVGGEVFTLGDFAISPNMFGLIVSVAIFALFYKDSKTKLVEFQCLPYQPPVGGDDCEKCNDYEECTEYTCKSLGQACQLLEGGKCAWVNPHDTLSPRIEVMNVSEEHRYVPDPNLAPDVRGVIISKKDGSCIKAFTPLEFTVQTDEPSVCKIDYNLTISKEDSAATFDNMAYYVGGSNLYSYNHSEKLSLPGPDAINKIAPELKNDGQYTLYVRCRDANGNFNTNAYSVRFCVDPGPDTTPPIIENVNVPSKSPIQFNHTTLEVEVYVNEPAECKWDRDDRDYESMENSMDCSLNIWEMNNQNVYTCRSTLTGIENRKENDYYLRCKDQPYVAVDSDRNVNVQSYLYTLIGTQPLNILKVDPNETIFGSTDTIPVTLGIETDNGYKDGESTCYYSTSGEEADYIEFLETGTNAHEQRQDLITGDYIYYFKCVDLGGNTVYNSTNFRVETDKQGPIVTRAYKESGKLKIITDEKAECSYSFIDCNFEIEDGIQMTSLDFKNHNAEWKISKTYFTRCKDKYNNQPDPNTCSITIKPFKLDSTSSVIEL